MDGVTPLRERESREALRSASLFPLLPNTRW